jgi:hypothetical protein
MNQEQVWRLLEAGREEMLTWDGRRESLRDPRMDVTEADRAWRVAAQNRTQPVESPDAEGRG